MSRRAAFVVAMAALGAAEAAAEPAFTYHAPGDLRVGVGRRDRDIYLKEILFPLAVGPAADGAQAFANSQLHTPVDRSFAYPWRDTYCEERSWTMPLCPSGKGHQGVDIRPNGPQNRQWLAVAMDNAIVTTVTDNTTVILRAADYTCRYLHLDRESIRTAGIEAGKRVRKGDTVGKVSNIMGGRPNTSLHLHFDCAKVINGRSVHIPVYTALVAAYRRAWGIAPLPGDGSALAVDPVREVGTGPGATGPVATGPVDPTLPKTFQTRNYGAITPQTEPPAWPPYIRAWPGLDLSRQIRDKFGKIIPAFSSDEQGIGLWWYWVVRRANFGPEGSVTFRQLAQKYAGVDNPDHPAVRPYVASYSGDGTSPGVSRHYFGRTVPADELLNLGDRDVRWNIAQTMFRHEGGRPLPFTRDAFNRGISLAEAVLAGLPPPVSTTGPTTGGPVGPSVPQEGAPGPATPVTPPVAPRPVPVADAGEPRCLTPRVELVVRSAILRFCPDIDRANLTALVKIVAESAP